jgi:hypothetical protein
VADPDLPVTSGVRQLQVHIGSAYSRIRSRMTLHRQLQLLGAVTDPVTPLIGLGAAAGAAILLPYPWLGWAVLGAVAGYALSGSV